MEPTTDGEEAALAAKFAGQVWRSADAPAGSTTSLSRGQATRRVAATPDGVGSGGGSPAGAVSRRHKAAANRQTAPKGVNG